MSPLLRGGSCRGERRMSEEQERYRQAALAYLAYGLLYLGGALYLSLIHI